MEKIPAIRGVKDILPGEVEAWQYVEDTARRLFETYGFSEIRIPIFEATELFSRGIGETTDIVEKEMYTFQDKGGKSITLRPEGTAPVVRAYIENKLHALSPIAKLYYLGPMFRYERPQAGRYRQFYQIGIEVLGIKEPLIDIEVLSLLHQLFESIGIREREMQINSLGCKDCRPCYRSALQEFLLKVRGSLCQDCQRRINLNPLRVLDCKREECKKALFNAPNIHYYLCEDCRTHFKKVEDGLSDLGIPYKINERLVRGLDYYTKTAFEMVSNLLGSQNAFAAGGRYDGLVEDLGGPAIPGIGFAIGMERVVSLIDRRVFDRSKVDLYIATIGEEAKKICLPLMLSLRQKGIRIETDYEGSSLKSQMRKADKFKARYVLIIGEEEIKKGKALLRDMGRASQEEILLSHLPEEIGQKIK